MPRVLTSEDVARGAVGLIAPMNVQFCPDDKIASYLYPDSEGNRQVFSLNLEAPYETGMVIKASTTEELSLQEQLRRERMRLFTKGVASYEWDQSSTQRKLIIPTNGQIVMFDDQNRVVYDGSSGPAVDPHISPNGKHVAFVINDDLYCVNIPDAQDEAMHLQRLTVNGAKPGVTCGLADYIAQEEMHRFRGFWWSPDGESIAYCEADENMVPEYQILHQGKHDPKHSETHRYPFAGMTNPHVKLGVVKIASTSTSTAGEGEQVSAPVTQWLDIDSKQVITSKQGDSDCYVARVDWWRHGTVMAQVQDRDQQVLQLFSVNPDSGVKTLLIEESTTVWTNLHEMWHCCALQQDGSFDFIWASERSGFMQLYLYHYNTAAGTVECLLNGKPIGGGGDWVVESIDAVDEERKLIYFSANKDNLTERNCFWASYGPDSETVAISRLTGRPGWHTVFVSVKSNRYLDIHSSSSSAPVTSLYALDSGELLAVVNDSSVGDARLADIKDSLQTPKIVTVLSGDGQDDLYVACYTPDPSQHGLGPYPTIVSVYGGPHVQRVQNNWSLCVDLRAQQLAQLGFLVIKCDNRGSSRRGLQFEGKIKWNMGDIEVQDQVTAVQALILQGLADAGRVGMFGWSYGGYMSAISLCRAPGVFKCAVAGAPVTHWDGYDTHYTERYMGTPASNPAGYTISSVMEHVPNMTGRLFLVHGLIDENVHFRHTARLINALIQHRKRYDLLLFPCERHSPHKIQDRIYLEDRMMDFMREQLMCSSDVKFPTAHL